MAKSLEDQVAALLRAVVKFFKGVHSQLKKSEHEYYVNVCIIIYKYMCSTAHHIHYKIHEKIKT